MAKLGFEQRAIPAVNGKYGKVEGLANPVDQDKKWVDRQPWPEQWMRDAANHMEPERAWSWFANTVYDKTTNRLNVSSAFVQNFFCENFRDILAKVLNSKLRIIYVDKYGNHHEKPLFKAKQAIGEQYPFPDKMPHEWREYAVNAGVENPDDVFYMFKKKYRDQVSSRWDNSWKMHISMRNLLKTF